jgi:hypothetical protein
MMLKQSLYGLSFVLGAFALVLDGSECTSKSLTMSLIGGAPGPCFVQGTANCPPPNLTMNCANVGCVPNPNDPNTEICTPHTDPIKVYVEQVQFTTTYNIAQATATNTGKKDVVYGNEVRCVVDKECQNCVITGFFSGWECQSDGPIRDTKESRTSSSPGGQNCNTSRVVK